MDGFCQDNKPWNLMNWINPQAIAVDKSANARMVTIYKKIHGLFKLGMGRHVPSCKITYLVKLSYLKIVCNEVI
jgi:hypothetical protein